MARKRGKAGETNETVPASLDGPLAASGAAFAGLEESAGGPDRAEDDKDKPGRRWHEHLTLSGFETWSSSVRSIFLNGLFLLAILVVLPVLVSQFRRDQVVIEPIAVPESLSNEGLTADVAASRVWDGLQDVAARAKTSKESLSAIPQARRVEFSFPDSGFSVESLIFHVRKLFNAYETRISGEFVCSDGECSQQGLRLRLRVIRDHVDIIDMPPIGDEAERDYFADAATHVMAILDPFVAIAADADKQPLRATTLARRLIRSHHKDAKWAHNLVGLIRVNAGDLPAAVDDFRAAIALDPGFLPARTNLGNTLRLSGDLDGAKAEFDDIHRRAPGDVRAVEGFADIALARNDADGAVKHLLDAADLDPESPRYFAKAGKIELDRGRKDQGIALLQRALELDPGYLPASAYLAATYMVDSNYEAVEKIYRDAADYAPDDADAQASEAGILGVLHRWDEAALRYKRAITLDDKNAGYWLNYARSLQQLGRQDEALAALDTAQKLAPANADIYSALGDSYRDTNRKADAIAAYRKYLELDKSNGPMRTVIQKFIEILSG